MEEKEMIKLSMGNPEGRREFIKKAGIGTAGILAAGTAPMAYAKSIPSNGDYKLIRAHH